MWDRGQRRKLIIPRHSCFYFWYQGGSGPGPGTIPVPGDDSDNGTQAHLGFMMIKMMVMVRQQRQRVWERWQAGCGFTNLELQFSDQERSTSTWETALSSSVSWGNQTSLSSFIFCKINLLILALTKKMIFRIENVVSIPFIINLCRDNVGQPEFVFWFHNSTMINFQPGVTVETSLIGAILDLESLSGFPWNSSDSIPQNS